MNQNHDLFDMNGAHKLTDKSVELREELVSKYYKDPKTLWLISTSGGKDSQAMYLKCKEMFPRERTVVVHANLGRVEHKGVIEHIESTIDHPLVVVQHESMDLVDMTLDRGMFASSMARFCTSGQKTGVIDKWIKGYMKEHGYTTVFNVTGLRAEESAMRAQKYPLWVNSRLSTQSRQAFDFMPIFHYSEDEVYDAIEAAGQTPHPIYGNRGDKNKRLSCIFCIVGCASDLANGARNYPDHYGEMIAVERVTNHTMFHKTRTARSAEPLAKGDTFEGLTVLGCTKLKRQPGYSVKLSIPVSLEERAGVPVDESIVQKHIGPLKERQKELQKLRADKLAEKEHKRALKSPAMPNRDPRTIDFIAA